jgi:hypothetical protein
MTETELVKKLQRKDDRSNLWVEVPVGTWGPGLNGMVEWLESLNPGDQAVTEVVIGQGTYRLHTALICKCCRREM